MFHPNSQQKHDYPTLLLEFFDTIIGWQSLRLTQSLNIKIYSTYFVYMILLSFPSSLPFFNGGTTPASRILLSFRTLSALILKLLSNTALLTESHPKWSNIF